jgi:hypothetical protein
MRWNLVRLANGFAPELWYRVCDEEGLLVQDEAPLRVEAGWPAGLPASSVEAEFTEWIRDRWNHPCLAIWDPQCDATGAGPARIVSAVRTLDLSDRPWETDPRAPARLTDVAQAPPPAAPLLPAELAALEADATAASTGSASSAVGPARILHGCDRLWLDRAGQPAAGTEDAWRRIAPGASPEERRALHAAILARKIEFWRAQRAAAGVMHGYALTHGVPGQRSADHWRDVRKLEWQADYARLAGDAFHPVGVSLGAWGPCAAASNAWFRAPVTVVNDLNEEWTGRVRFVLNRGDRPVLRSTPEELRVAAGGRVTADPALRLAAPPGRYEIAAELEGPGAGAIRSRRELEITP